MNINHNMDLIHIVVFGAIIVGVLTYSCIVYVLPVNDGFVKLLQKYEPELFTKYGGNIDKLNTTANHVGQISNP